MKPALTTPELDQLLRSGAPVAFGVSGGKDSVVAVAAGMAHLDSLGHPRSKRILIHSDLGLIEWADSGRICDQLAERFGTPLITVRRAAGGMIERWETRWANVSERYRELRSVALTLPWSTPSMRFCTSELKTDVISAELKRRFPGEHIISVSGIRRAESKNRAKTPIVKAAPKLRSVRRGTIGFDWAPIADFSLLDVWAAFDELNLPKHEAYRVYGASRVSCSFCIMSSAQDLSAAFSNPENRRSWEALVSLELRSAFSFQGNRWLADLGLANGDAAFREGVEQAKRLAGAREAAEAKISKSLLYVKGWPTFVPTDEQAEMIASVRRVVCGLYGWDSPYLDAASVRSRYKELFDARTDSPVSNALVKSCIAA